MSLFRPILLIAAAILIPGGLVLLVPLILRGYRGLIEARRHRPGRAAKAPASCQDCQIGA